MSLSLRKKIASRLRTAFAAAAMAVMPASAFAQNAAPARDNAAPDAAALSPAKALQAEMNRQLKETNNPYYDKVIVFDSDRFDEKVGISHSRAATVRQMLFDEGFRNPSENRVWELAETVTTPGMSPSGAPVLTVSPASFPMPEQRLCIVANAPENALIVGADFPPPGVDGKTAARIMNEHERLHCLDPATDQQWVNPYKPIINKTHFEDMPWDKFPQVSGYPGLLEAYAMYHRAESFADVGAVGNEIRRGGDISLITKYADWRAAQADEKGRDDPVHATTESLRELGRRIRAMGVENFRKMDDAAAISLYSDIAGTTGISTPRAVTAFIIRAYGTDEQKAEAAEMAQTDREVRSGINAYVMWRTLPAYRGPAPDAAKDAEGPPHGDAAKTLKAETKAREHKVIPLTVMKTFKALRDGLRQESSADPARAAWNAEEGARLRTAFLSQALGLRVVDVDGHAFIDRPGHPAPKPAPKTEPPPATPPKP